MKHHQKNLYLKFHKPIGTFHLLHFDLNSDVFEKLHKEISQNEIETAIFYLKETKSTEQTHLSMNTLLNFSKTFSLLYIFWLTEFYNLQFYLKCGPNQ